MIIDIFTVKPLQTQNKTQYFVEAISKMLLERKVLKKIPVLHLIYFTQNKSTSGCFWAASLTVNTVNKMLTASKIHLF